MSSRTGLSILLIAGLGACATPGPIDNIEGPAAAIRAAEEVGAAKIPAAALRLQIAREQLDRAKTMTSDQERPKAQRWLMRSQADAELALALARSSAARAAADKAIEKNKDLSATVR